MSREAYYSESQESVGHWGGRGARRLGLGGAVEQEQFERLCDNLHPNSAGGESLTARQKLNRRVGYDINFHCPKSVSLYHALSGDERVVVAFRDSVRATMEEMEAATKTRVRRDGKDITRPTGELVWANFEHYTARPVGGVPDPHLHAHVVCFNATFDDVEGRWKAIDLGDVKRDATYYEAAFHARFAGSLREQGFSIRRTRDRWELGGLGRETLAKFAGRTEQIEALAEKLGITSGAEKDTLGARTRRGKVKDLTRPELREAWARRLDEGERGAIEAVARHEVAPGERVSLSRAIEYAKLHGYERESVISEKRLMAHALRYGVGSVSVEEVNREVAASGRGLITRDVDGQRLTTTTEVLAEERRMLTFARDGRGTCLPLARGRAVGDERLSAEQRVAVRHVWDSSDRVMLVRGAAGVGKTTLMQEVVAGVEEGGTRVHAFAPSASASRGTLREEGFAGADTLASLLSNPRVQAGVRGGLIWVDEAGQVGTRDLAKLFDVADRLHARVLLTGDVRQHGPVARGDAMRLLQEQAGCHAAEVVEIRRQSGEYREAVKALSEGDGARGFARLDRLGFIEEIEGPGRHRRMASAFLAATDGARDWRKEALCIAPTHVEGAAISAEIRAGLKGLGRLSEEERGVTRLRNRSLTEAERGDAAQYAAGDTVQLVQNIKGFTRGERLTVVGASPSGAVRAARGNGDMVDLPLGQADRFQVYRAESLPIAAGEMLRVTQNGSSLPDRHGRKHRVNNGDLHTVRGFTDEGHLQLANGWVLPRDFGHLDHGYCQTSYSSQSRTVKRVFIAQGEQSLPASDLKQFYVSVSRGKAECRVYTDSKDALFERVQAAEQRLAATELLTPSRRPERDRLDRLKDLAEEVVRKKIRDATIAAKKLGRALRGHGPANRNPREPGALNER